MHMSHMLDWPHCPLLPHRSERKWLPQPKRARWRDAGAAHRLGWGSGSGSELGVWVRGRELGCLSQSDLVRAIG